MTARRAQFTEIEIRRALRAAKAEGFAVVKLIPSKDGPPAIECRIEGQTPAAPVDEEALDI